MKSDMDGKIRQLIKLGTSIDENQTRSLMILMRKEFELMTDVNRQKFLTLNLFSNWSAHTKIDKSMSGLRILFRVNNALVQIKQTVDNNTILTEMTKAIGFDTLRLELCLFLQYIGINEAVSDSMWKTFLDNLIEIIRDVPLSFPLTRELKTSEKKIYEQIAKNPIKPGAGVVMIVLSKIDYGKFVFGNIGEILCLLVCTEDTTKIIIPLALSR